MSDNHISVMTALSDSQMSLQNKKNHQSPTFTVAVAINNGNSQPEKNRLRVFEVTETSVRALEQNGLSAKCLLLETSNRRCVVAILVSLCGCAFSCFVALARFRKRILRRIIFRILLFLANLRPCGLRFVSTSLVFPFWKKA